MARTRTVPTTLPLCGDGSRQDASSYDFFEWIPICFAFMIVWKIMLFFSRLKKVLEDVAKTVKFLRANPKVSLGWGVRFRLPQYVSCEETVSIGEESRLYCWDSYGGVPLPKAPELSIGRGTRATRNLTIQCAGSVRIGCDVLIASDVFITDYNHGLDPASVSYLSNPLQVESVEVCDGAWIGNNVVILPGVRIGRKAVVGAGSVVSRSIPDYCIAVGNPARVVKRFDSISSRWVAAIASGVQ
ncbi:acyltransferase [Thermophilibacter provencensis]|uniref:acyltransferase n=1 Tax=Thermophilibacter provencensis TaxID=1852386 RepID=UPI002942FE2B|nr:acyltransferase [Thermophilibacter provencensis]